MTQSASLGEGKAIRHTRNDTQLKKSILTSPLAQEEKYSAKPTARVSSGQEIALQHCHQTTKAAVTSTHTKKSRNLTDYAIYIYLHQKE